MIHFPSSYAASLYSNNQQTERQIDAVRNASPHQNQHQQHTLFDTVSISGYAHRTSLLKVSESSVKSSHIKQTDIRYTKEQTKEGQTWQCDIKDTPSFSSTSDTDKTTTFPEPSTKATCVSRFSAISAYNAVASMVE